MERVTIKDIASVSGYSTMTVSCALRKDPRVRESTRRKIREVADRLGYLPDPELSKLMTYLRRPERLSKAHRLALINPYDRKDYFKGSSYEGMIYAGAVKRATQQGYKLEEFWLGQKGMNGKRLSKIIRSRGIEAILLPPWPGIGVQESFLWEDFAIAGTSDSFWKPSFHRVFPNSIYNMRILICHVRRLRYRHFGIVIPHDIDRRLHYAPGMVTEWYVKHKLRNCRISSFTGSLEKAGEFEAWVSECQPEVVVSFEPRPYRRILQMGLSIPGDIGFACQDVSVLNHSGLLNISGVDPRPDLIGAAAVDLLVGQLARFERGIPGNARIVMLEGDWVPGATLRRAR